MTALLMLESHIGTMDGLLYFVLAYCKCVGHLEALHFLLWLGHVGLLAFPARSGVRWQWPSLVPPGIPGGQMEAGCAPGVLDGIVVGEVPCLVPPGMPGGQMEAECAPGVLDGIVVGVVPFDEGTRGQWCSELHLEELSQGW